MPAIFWRGMAVAMSLAGSLNLIDVAQAAATCFPRDAIIRHLSERYGERPIATGVARDHLVLLLARPDGASWTILLVPAGSGGGDLACPLTAGEGWRAVTEPTPPEGLTTPESSS